METIEDQICFVPQQPKINLECEANQRCVRTRSLLMYLTHSLVGVKNALPSNVFNKKFEAVKYPPTVVKNKLYSQFGLEMEKLVAFVLHETYKEKFITHPSTEKEFTWMTKNFITKLISAEQSLAIQHEITNFFTLRFPTLKTITYGAEFFHGNVSGHPDFVVSILDENSIEEIIILDCKVFARTVGGKDNRAIRAQLAMYIALARKMGYRCNTVGVIMPWMRNPVCELYSVGGWNSDHLVPLALTAAVKVQETPMNQFNWMMRLQMNNIGSHITKEEAFSFIKNKAPRQAPFQIFLLGNIPSAAIEKKGMDEIEKLKYITPGCFSTYKAYVHAPYNLNLASTNGYVPKSARLYLEFAGKLGFRGVVFHVGHHAEEDEGVKQMKINLDKIFDSLPSDAARFLLETPCGNKNELLNTPAKFSEFCDSFVTDKYINVFNGTPNKKFGVCVDTCHVFVSGFQPLNYLASMTETCQRNIRLIHFNGSRKTFGSKADGHAHVCFMQNIAESELVGVVNYGLKNQIDCVTE